jgi:branched-chain amino acid aminotransferase
MNEPLAFLDNRFVPQSAAVVPVWDAGFMLGATVSEQLRTFRGSLFELPAHLDRLARSLAVVGVECPLDRHQLAETAAELVAHNHRLLAPGDDLGLSLFVTPGPYATLAPQAPPRPLVGMHSYPLPFRLWSRAYQQGVALVTVDVEQVPPRSWPASLKCRSRMHYYLADQQARQLQPGARALLLNADGSVSETATANALGWRQDEGLLSPPRERILPGISLAYVGQLAASASIPMHYRDLLPEDLARADEVLLTSTPNCLLPVTQFNGQPVGSGVPGDVFQRLLEDWSRQVGIDIAEQARRFTDRTP